MAKKTDRNLIVGLDIGTSKVAAIVGEHTGNGEIEVIGIGCTPSRGLKKGVVVNLESTVQSIRRAVEEAELMAGCQISSVFAGIAGSHIKSLNSHGIVAIKDKEVTRYRQSYRFSKSGSNTCRPENSAYSAAGVRDRSSGRHQGTDRDVRHPVGSQSTYGHR